MSSIALLLLLVGACTPSRGDGDAGDGGVDPPGTLTISPAQVDLDLMGRDQVVSLNAVSSRHGDVTQTATWWLSDNSIGAVSGGKVTVRGALEAGGIYQVHAEDRGERGSATLRVKVKLPDIVDSTAPSDAKDYFSGAASGPAPELVYPFDNTLMAPNVLQVSLAWRAGSGQQVFKIVASGPTYERAFYVGGGRCRGGDCTYPVDDRVWSGLGHSSLGSAVTLTVLGTVDKGAPVGASPPVTIRFSPEEVRGGLYYFSPTAGGIKRVPFGARQPIDFLKGDETGCAGCHAVSRDGKQVAAEFGAGNTMVGSMVVDSARPQVRRFPLDRTIAWNFAWFNPRGDRLLTNWKGQMIVRNPITGAQIDKVDQAYIGGEGGAMPEWSPDGKWIAFVRILSPSQADFQLQNSGDIVVMPYNDGTFGPAETLVKGDKQSDVHIWPSWTPDSRWLVFTSLSCGGGCNSYDAAATRLRLVRAVNDDGTPAVGAGPVELVAGTHAQGEHNNWPKVAPFLQADRYVFVVYSASHRWDFSPVGADDRQLFMFGIDLKKIGAGDPSYQPIWLPFQERSTSNHSAIWTTDVVCAQDGDCPAEFQCAMGRCVPKLG